MRIFFIFILLTLIGCKQKETPVPIDDISGCIQKEYKGDFKGSIIQMKITEAVQQDSITYRLKGSTTHKNTEVGWTGTLQQDDLIEQKKNRHIKLNYTLTEAAAEHGAGTFRGYVLMNVPYKKSGLQCDKASIQFIGNYTFPNGSIVPCTFGLTPQ